MQKSNHKRPDESWPIIKVDIPGFRTIFLRGLYGEKTPNHYPFEVTVNAGTGGALTAKVSPGTLNNIIPTNIFDDISVAATGMAYIWLDVTTDGKKVTSMTIATGAALTGGNDATADTAPSSFKVPIAIVKDAKVLTIVRTNLSYLPKVWMVAPKKPASAGEEPFTRWWAWSLV